MLLDDEKAKGSANNVDEDKLKERLKELTAINQTTAILRSGKSIDEALRQICMILPNAWKYPEFTVCRIRYAGIETTSSSHFRESQWSQKQAFETIDNQKGVIEIFYLKEFAPSIEGPFLAEERHLLINIANLISGYVNSIKGKAILKIAPTSEAQHRTEKTEDGRFSRHLLQTFLNRSNYNRDIYHDLMPFRVREILLIANLYDVYSIEKDGRFSEHILGEFYQLSLGNMPRITGVSSEEEVYEHLGSRHFDLVIIMMGVDKRFPIEISQKVKEHYPYIPVFLLLNSQADLSLFDNSADKLTWIDKTFVWNGDSRIFFAMINYLEDKINVENDTKIGITRVIIVVEDSPKYYSLYLPLLYNIVLEQTKQIIEDVTTNELYRTLQLKARPKIMLASTYEEAMYFFNKYKDYILCLVSDVKFKKDGRIQETAGIQLVQQFRKEIKELPVMIQSTEAADEKKANAMQTSFINKNSQILLQEFRSFITQYLGFGNFIYRDKYGQQIAIARTLEEFQDFLSRIPIDSLEYHARKNHFSMWLMARGEFQIARIFSPAKVSDFKDPEGLRQYLISVLQHFRNERKIGKIIPFDESTVNDDKNMNLLAEGALGGKGRGLAFVNSLIYNYDFSKFVPNIHLKIPRTFIIGTNEFDNYIDKNSLRDVILHEDYEKIKRKFISGKLSSTLVKKLKVIIRLDRKPLAVRSSGIFEDSLNQPFAGIFDTFMIPNNDHNEDARLEQLMDAIKLVYASLYSDTARAYAGAVNIMTEYQKMAVVIQEVVGNNYSEVYYPHLSGVAQSYNYYPIGQMKPEDGFAVCALGLGRYVVEGGKAYRFSPKHPTIEISQLKDQYKASQVKFYAVDLSKAHENLLEGSGACLRTLELEDAEKHGTLKHLASVYSPEKNKVTPGLSQKGPRIVNFADILKYNYIPLAKIIEVFLDVIKDALGSPVEIEFAVDLNKDIDNKASFYVLQIKPLIGEENDYHIELDELPTDKTILYSEKGMGNGLIEGIEYIVFADPGTFEMANTEEMASEIERINARMIRENKKYILIGPGRWGTKDKWIGIPVTWPQISNASVIVETSIEGFPLDASSGSHFFHNITSMKVGYFSIQPETSKSYIEYEKIIKFGTIENLKYFKIARFSKGLTIKMDGKKRIAVIMMNH